MSMTYGLVTAGLPIDPTDLLAPLGGSETALLSMASALRDRGHDVKVFCELVGEKGGRHRDIDFIPHQNFQDVVSVSDFNVLVVSRWPEFLAVPSFAGLRVLWVHDMPVSRDRAVAGLWQSDLVVVLSQFHKDAYVNMSPELARHIYISSNGVDLDVIEENLRPKVPGKIVFTSRPERGLHYVLKDILPRLLEKQPDIKLYFCNYSIEGLKLQPQVKSLIEFSYNLARRYPRNVVDLGNLSKSRLYQEISSAECWVYPTDFPEISCIGAMEAQACGTAIVSTDDFALSETVENGKTGFLIDGKPTEEAYQTQFANRVLQLLGDHDLAERMEEAGKSSVRERGYTWRQVAEKWDNKFSGMLGERWESSKEKIIQRLVQNSDLVPAYQLSEEYNLPGVEVLGAAVSQVQENNNALHPEATAAKRFKGAMQRFERVASLLADQGFEASRLLDFACGDTSFALYYKRGMSACECIAADRSKEVLQRVSGWASRSNLDISTQWANTLRHFGEQSFDLVFLGDFLDVTASVDELVATVLDAQRLLKDEGYLAFTVRFGSVDVGVAPTDRSWNFSLQDFRDMFRKNKSFNGMVTVEDISSHGDACGHWCCILQAGEVVSPDISRRTLVTRPYQSIGAAIIVKDAENDIGRCLNSIRSVVDKIVVVDTGSTDGTLDVVRRYADEVREVEFDNFAQARNVSVEGIGTDWVLWIDSDEVLVDGGKMRKYTQGRVFNGFVIRQNHLMLDLHGTFDVPIRLYRNLPNYRFNGLIHEHCEDVSVHEFDDSIKPTLVIPDVQIAHYGYITEKFRRFKASNRNMDLLLRAMKEEPGRSLNWVLAIRDFLNIVKWATEDDSSRIPFGGELHQLLNAAAAVHLTHLSDPEHPRNVMAVPMYQEVLGRLGLSGIPFEKRLRPPFQVAFALAGAYGGLEEDVVPNKQWFVDSSEFLNFVMDNACELIAQLTDRKKSEVLSEFWSKPFPVEAEEEHDVVKLLGFGANIVPTRWDISRGYQKE